MPVRYNNAGGMGIAANSFSGIDESSGYHNLDLAYASDAKNVDTAQGIFRPMAGFKPFPEVVSGTTTTYPTIDGAVVTLASFYRRNIATESIRSVCVACTATKMYYWYEGLSAWQEVERRTAVSGSTVLTFTSGAWSWVTYEDTIDDETVDVLILSNASDGMYVLYGDELNCDPVATTNLPQMDEHVVKFAHISRHSERIWGTGGVWTETTEEGVTVNHELPDDVYYSRPYEFDDWTIYYDPTTSEALPEQSGGSLQLPTWDGDAFVGLRRFSNYLMLFKKNSVFYVKGMTAGEFQTGEAYGTDGLFAPNTIVNDTAALVYLSDEGLGYFDGDTAQMMDNDRLASVFRLVGSYAAEKAVATIFRHVVYLALPVKTVAENTSSGVQTSINYTDPAYNNMLVTYDMRRGCYMKRPDINIVTMTRYVDRVLFTMGNNPGVVYQFDGFTQKVKTSSALTESNIPVEWVSSWQDGSRKDMTKTAFEIFLTGINATATQNITLTIETEKKEKSKTLTLSPTMKKMKVRIANKGRRWRLKIAASSNTDWEIGGGVQVDMETETN